MLITAGDQVPAMLFVEVMGKAGAAVPLHKVVGKLKVGTIGLVTATFNVKEAAHCPAFGVNT